MVAVVAILGATATAAWSALVALLVRCSALGSACGSACLMRLLQGRLLQVLAVHQVTPVLVAAGLMAVAAAAAVVLVASATAVRLLLLAAAVPWLVLAPACIAGPPVLPAVVVLAPPWMEAAHVACWLVECSPVAAVVVILVATATVAWSAVFAPLVPCSVLQSACFVEPLLLAAAPAAAAAEVLSPSLQARAPAACLAIAVALVAAGTLVSCACSGLPAGARLPACFLWHLPPSSSLEGVVCKGFLQCLGLGLRSSLAGILAARTVHTGSLQGGHPAHLASIPRS